MPWEFFGICGVWKVLGQEWEGNVSVFITEYLRHAEQEKYSVHLVKVQARAQIGQWHFYLESPLNFGH